MTFNKHSVLSRGRSTSFPTAGAERWGETTKPRQPHLSAIVQAQRLSVFIQMKQIPRS